MKIDPDRIYELISEQGWHLEPTSIGTFHLAPPMADRRRNFCTKWTPITILLPEYMNASTEEEISQIEELSPVEEDLPKQETSIEEDFANEEPWTKSSYAKGHWRDFHYDPTIQRAKLEAFRHGWNEHEYHWYKNQSSQKDTPQHDPQGSDKGESQITFIDEDVDFGFDESYPYNPNGA